MPTVTIRAAVTPGSFDADSLTFEVVWATRANRVRRERWDAEDFDEELGFDPENVRLERLNGGAALLDSHGRMGFQGGMPGLGDQIGAVVPGSASVDGNRGVATVQLLNHESNARNIAGVRDGLFRSISVGYIVHRYRDVTESDDGLRVLRAIDWEPVELSLLPIPADHAAGIRGQNRQTFPCVVELNDDAQTRASNPMDEDEVEVEEQQSADEATNEASVDGDGVVQTRAANRGASAPVEGERESGRSRETESAAPNAGGESAAALERTRIRTIQDECSRMGMPSTDRFVRGLVDNGTNLSEARRLIIERAAADDDALETRSASRVDVGEDERPRTLRAIETALMHRAGCRNADANGRYTAPIILDEQARDLRGLTLTDMGRHVLRSLGVRRTEYLPPVEVAKLLCSTRAIGSSSSDFPAILRNVANRRLQGTFMESPRTFLPLVRETTTPDFKTFHRPSLGEGSSLEVVEEKGAYKQGTLGEKDESAKLVKYGKQHILSWEAMINDDLSAFDRIPALWGAAAARSESDAFWTDLIIANVTLADGFQLFDSANHGNLTTSNPISVAGLGTVRAKMRNQTGIDGSIIHVTPSFLIVRPTEETLAQQFTSQITPDSGGSVNPFQSAFQQVIVEPRLETFAGWYMASSPSQMEVAEIVRLTGQEGPVIETKTSFDIDGIAVKVRHSFAVLILEHRAFQRSANS